MIGVWKNCDRAWHVNGTILMCLVIARRQTKQRRSLVNEIPAMQNARVSPADSIPISVPFLSAFRKNL